jgi:hypothetical protein
LLHSVTGHERIRISIWRPRFAASKPSIVFKVSARLGYSLRDRPG